MEQCIPRHSVRRKHNLPWLTTNIVRHIRKRNTMFQKAKRSKKESHYDQFKKLRNTVVSLMRKEKQKYFSNLTGANTKKFWKAVKHLNKNKQSIPTLEQDNVYAESDVDKADMLNDFFAKCWNCTEPPLTNTADAYVGNEAILDDFILTSEEVLHHIKRLDVTKANGPDGISGHMLKATSNSIATPLAKLFNLSLSRGKFPKSWKSASVVPIPKSNKKSIPSGYRPISLLSVVSKLLEKLIHSRISEHLAEHAPISDAQWGFQKGKCTVTALLSTTHDWLMQIHQRKDIYCVFFDLQKAFDSVPHRRLMERLAAVDLNPLLLSWLHSYLSEREQHVVMNGKHSRSVRVLSGVPQGSVLGPLLFLIYVTSITSIQLSESTKFSLYADDMLIYKPISTSSNYRELQEDINIIFQ